jgi:hypothetical protein
MPEQKVSTTFSDIANVVSVKIDGELPVIVGGHAVNIWALAYLHRAGANLKAFAPFTTKDLDLYGPIKILEKLGEKFGVPVALSPPRLPGLGHVLIPQKETVLKVELLPGVHGLQRIEAQNIVKMTIEGTEIRVLDAISCLKAKIANAADLDQANRQDVKHAQIMKICAHEFIKDILIQGNRGQITERLVVNNLENLLEIVTSREAQKVELKWGLRFADVLPMEVIRQCPMEKVKNFVRYRIDRKLELNQFDPPQQSQGGFGIKP